MEEIASGREASLSYLVENEELYVTSVSGRIEGFTNCIANLIYCFDIKTRKLDEVTEISSAPPTVSSVTDTDFQDLEKSTQELYKQLCHSVYQRMTTIQPVHPENRNIGVLFSGGLDCSVIAAILCEELMNTGRSQQVSIELLNVGFENPRTHKQPEDTPDRQLALRSYRFLQQLYPEISMKLVKVDVPYEKYLSKRETVIDLIYPKNTEMDLSIAIAFYFASRGEGSIVENDAPQPYKRKSLVLFSGLGADELYGGYHKFSNKTTEELVAELQKQIGQIHDRNLNRDDKVIASNGVEVRYPFLDESVVQFSTNLPINYKVNKLVLRKLAEDILHLDSISQEPKRAIQFGARSAKMTKDGNKNGTDMLKSSVSPVH